MIKSTAHLNEPSIRNLTNNELSNLCSNDEDFTVRRLSEIACEAQDDMETVLLKHSDEIEALENQIKGLEGENEKLESKIEVLEEEVDDLKEKAEQG